MHLVIFHLSLSNVNNNNSTMWQWRVFVSPAACEERDRQRERLRETQLLSGPKRRRRTGGERREGGGGRPGGGVGGTCRVACRFHWERGKHQVNIYELSPPEDFRHPSVSLSVLDLPLLFIYLGYLFIFFKPTSGVKPPKLRIYANPTWESTTFVKLKRRNVSFLCETNVSDSCDRHLTR